MGVGWSDVDVLKSARKKAAALLSRSSLFIKGWGEVKKNQEDALCLVRSIKRRKFYNEHRYYDVASLLTCSVFENIKTHCCVSLTCNQKKRNFGYKSE